MAAGDATFESVSALGLPEQRDLLLRGDAPARLYAAWAIALRLGMEAWPLLRTATFGDVPEGLRRQYIVIIAGFGERDILWTLAMHDPYEEVRATAAAYFIRTAPNPRDSVSIEFASSLLAAAPDTIRIAVLDEFEAGRIDLAEAPIVTLLGHSSDELRRRAVFCLLARPRLSEEALRSTAEAIVQEGDATVRRTFVRAMARPQIGVLARTLLRADSARVTLLLGELKSELGSLEWSELQCLAGLRDAEVQDGVLDALRKPIPADALSWAGLAYVDLRDSPSSPWIRWNFYRAIVRAISPQNVGALGSAVRAVLTDDIRRELVGIDADIVFDEDDCSAEDFAEWQTLLATTISTLGEEL